MKRILLVALLATAGAAAGAQNFSEALRYSDSNYYGTARSIALGNAVTALGGDLGTIGINPAGSAVAGYSQFTISPGVTLMSNTSGYSTFFQQDYTNYQTNIQRKFTVPNVGLALKFDTFEDNGIKSFTIGFVANTTNKFLNGFVGTGINDATSFLGSLAAGASPYTPEELNYYDNYDRSNIPWDYLMAYQSGMIADAFDEEGYPMVDDQGYYTYVGTSEVMTPNGDGTYDIRTPGSLDQLSKVTSYGSTTDIIMNFGLNYDDKFFAGLNFGIPCGTYSQGQFFRETAVDPSLFEIEYMDGAIANFSHSTYNYYQTTDMSGIYAKLGFIWLPLKSLRIGAAFQTPTLMTITDRWSVEGTTNFTDSRYNSSAYSPENRYSYDLRTPWHFNAGVAYTLGTWGLLSADFEMADFSCMRYSVTDEYGYNDYFAVENDVNRNFGGKQYAGRFGIEVKPLPAISLRAGYSYKTSGEYYRYDNTGEKFSASGYLNYYDDFASGRYTLQGAERLPDVVSAYSFGVGYSSVGPFFADVAFRRTSYPTAYFSPYNDYITGGDEYLPETEQTRKLSDVVVTLGWRF